MLHQHSDTEPDRICLIRFDPPADRLQQFFSMFPEHLRGHLITGGPVIDKRQESFYCFQTCFIILHPRNDKCMDLVLIKRFMRQLIQKRIQVIPLAHLLCQFAKLRCTHTNEIIWRNRRYQFTLEITILYILQLV